MMKWNIPSDDNNELWNDVINKLKTQPSVIHLLNDDVFPVIEPELGHMYNSAISLTSPTREINPETTLALPVENYKIQQRKILACITDNLDELKQVNICPLTLKFNELCNEKSLIVHEDTLKKVCDIVGIMTPDIAEAVVVLVLLPTVSQMGGQLAHPCQQSLSHLLHKQPTVLVEMCLCPVLEHSVSQHAMQFTAKLLQQLPTSLVTHVPSLMSSLANRIHFEENDLVIVETACGMIPKFADEKINNVALAESVILILQHVCDKLPKNSIKVGRMLLAAFHKLASYIAAKQALKDKFTRIVENHESSLQRPIKAQLNKI